MRSPAAKRRVLVNSAHHLPPNSVAIRRTNPNKWIELTVGVRRLKQLPDLSALEAKSPGERQYMTRDQLRTEYGSDPAAIAKIEKFAADHDLVVTRNEPASARLGIAGTVASVSQAFGVKLLNYKHPKLGDFYARTGPVALPVEVARAITGVFGLNNHRVMHRLPRSRQKVDAVASFSKTRPWFIPTELAGIYNFPDADACSQCIGLLEFGGGIEHSDVAAYFQKIGLPAPNVQIVAVDGVSTDPTADPDSTGEVMLDVDIAGALAGGAKVAVYFSTFDEKGLIDILSTVINDQTNDPSVLSVSWGWDENQPFNNGILWSAAAIEHVNHSLLAVAHLGITVCVSTGDDGSESQIQDGHAHVNFPATSPYVLAVGGTTLHARKGTNDQMAVTEVVWNDGPESGGGGGVTPIPSWQEGRVPRSINPGSFAGRAIPDVAANADPNTGYLVMNGGQFGIVGGTSASAPLWASLVSRINALNGARAGNFNALLYTTIGPAGALRDITSGQKV
jgi:kumamolisin